MPPTNSRLRLSAKDRVGFLEDKNHFGCPNRKSGPKSCRLTQRAVSINSRVNFRWFILHFRLMLPKKGMDHLLCTVSKLRLFVKVLHRCWIVLFFLARGWAFFDK